MWPPLKTAIRAPVGHTDRQLVWPRPQTATAAPVGHTDRQLEYGQTSKFTLSGHQASTKSHSLGGSVTQLVTIADISSK